MKRVIIGLLLFVSVFALFALENFDGTYLIEDSPTCKWAFMVIDGPKVTLINQTQEATYSFIVYPKEGLLYIGDFGFYFNWVGDLLVMTPAYGGADVVKARKF